MSRRTFPTRFVWDHGGEEVFLRITRPEGSEAIPLNKSSDGTFDISLSLGQGRYEYCFTVDGRWTHDPDLPAIKNESGYYNNMLKIVDPKINFSNKAPKPENRNKVNSEGGIHNFVEKCLSDATIHEMLDRENVSSLAARLADGSALTDTDSDTDSCPDLDDTTLEEALNIPVPGRRAVGPHASDPINVAVRTMAKTVQIENNRNDEITITGVALKDRQNELLEPQSDINRNNLNTEQTKLSAATQEITAVEAEQGNASPRAWEENDKECQEKMCNEKELIISAKLEIASDSINNQPSINSQKSSELHSEEGDKDALETTNNYSLENQFNSFCYHAVPHQNLDLTYFEENIPNLPDNILETHTTKTESKEQRSELEHTQIIELVPVKQEKIALTLSENTDAVDSFDILVSNQCEENLTNGQIQFQTEMSISYSNAQNNTENIQNSKQIFSDEIADKNITIGESFTLNFELTEKEMKPENTCQLTKHEEENNYFPMQSTLNSNEFGEENNQSNKSDVTLQKMQNESEDMISSFSDEKLQNGDPECSELLEKAETNELADQEHNKITSKFKTVQCTLLPEQKCFQQSIKKTKNLHETQECIGGNESAIYDRESTNNKESALKDSLNIPLESLSLSEIKNLTDVEIQIRDECIVNTQELETTEIKIENCDNPKYKMLDYENPEIRHPELVENFKNEVLPITPKETSVESEIVTGENLAITGEKVNEIYEQEYMENTVDLHVYLKEPTVETNVMYANADVSINTNETIDTRDAKADAPSLRSAEEDRLQIDPTIKTTEESIVFPSKNHPTSKTVGAKLNSDSLFQNDELKSVGSEEMMIIVNENLSESQTNPDDLLLIDLSEPKSAQLNAEKVCEIRSPDVQLSFSIEDQISNNLLDLNGDTQNIPAEVSMTGNNSTPVVTRLMDDDADSTLPSSSDLFAQVNNTLNTIQKSKSSSDLKLKEEIEKEEEKKESDGKKDIIVTMRDKVANSFSKVKDNFNKTLNRKDSDKEKRESDKNSRKRNSIKTTEAEINMIKKDSPETEKNAIPVLSPLEQRRQAQQEKMELMRMSKKLDDVFGVIRSESIDDVKTQITVRGMGDVNLSRGKMKKSTVEHNKMDEYEQKRVARQQISMPDKPATFKKPKPKPATPPKEPSPPPTPKEPTPPPSKDPTPPPPPPKPVDTPKPKKKSNFVFIPKPVTPPKDPTPEPAKEPSPPPSPVPPQCPPLLPAQEPSPPTALRQRTPDLQTKFWPRLPTPELSVATSLPEVSQSEPPRPPPLPLKVGINGFDRVGRLAFRAACDAGLDISAINDPFIPLHFMVYQLKLDIAHSRRRNLVVSEGTDGQLVVNNKPVLVFGELDPRQIPWHQAGVTTVIEATESLQSRVTPAHHLQPDTAASAATALKDIVNRERGGAAEAGEEPISAPAPPCTIKQVVVAGSSTEFPSFGVGVNDDRISPSMGVIGSISAPAHALVLILQILHKQFRVSSCSYTLLKAVMGPGKDIKSPNLGPASHRRHNTRWDFAANLVPAPCPVLEEETVRFLPGLRGRLHGLVVYTPVPEVSMFDLTVRLEAEGGDLYNAVCSEVERQAAGPLASTVKYVAEGSANSGASGQFSGCSQSVVFDQRSGCQIDRSTVKIVLWFDNEFGFANRIVDLVKKSYEVSLDK